MATSLPFSLRGLRSPSFPISSQIPELSVMKTFHLRPSAPKSLTLYTLSIVGLCVSSHILQEEASLMAEPGTDLSLSLVWPLGSLPIESASENEP